MEEFKLLYNDVFNNDGSIKNCGRTKCIQLIELSMKLKPNIDFGNIRTGFLNIENIIALYKELN